jgi:hypothetical protein
MNQVELNINETDAEILTKVLESDISDLSMEIRATDILEFRETLKTKRISLHRILEEIKKKSIVVH